MYLIKHRKNAKPENAGTKAWHLFLLNKHFAIPEFVVVSIKAFEEYQENKRVSPKLKTELEEGIKYFLRKGAVAIRSSATAEDLPGISFAGMYNTTLNITNTKEGIKAVIQTWNSVNSERVKHYCKKMNISTGKMAIIIQHQLRPETSGVMLTQSPYSIREVLIESCKGLGEKLVSGKITPTRYRIRENEIIRKEGENLLSEKQVFELVRIGKRIEKILKSPQDIEWSIEKGKIYILQSRSVLLNAALPRRPCLVWCNVNVRETMPEPISPLWWSLLDDLIFSIFIKHVFNFPITRKQYEKYRPIEMLSGRVYWNVNNMITYGKPIGPILDLVQGSRSMDPQLATAFKAVDLKYLPKPMSSFKMFWFTIIQFPRLVYYILLSFFHHGWMYNKIIKSYKKFESQYENFIPSNDLVQGVENVKNWLKSVMLQFARRYFGGVFLSILYNVLLARILSVRMGKKGEALAHKLVIGIIDKTGEMVLAVNDLVRLAKTKTQKITIMGLKKLYKKDKEFKNLFDNFIRNFGHRGPAEFDIASKNWREDLDMVYRLIQTSEESQSHNIDRKTMISHLLYISKSTEKLIIKTLLPRLEVFTPLREDGKHIYLRVAAKLKDQLFIIANILIARGFLKRKRDVFFLSLRDLDKIAQKKLTRKQVAALMKIRKQQWRFYKKTPAPDIIYNTGERITTSTTSSKILVGESLSYGKVKARTRIIKHFAESHKLKKGEILITHHTDPGWTPLFNIASGVIVEAGGVICHAAMVARELGTPAIVIRGATRLIPNGKMIELDADIGQVKIVSDAK